MEIDRRRSETSYVTSPSLHLSVCLYLSQSTMSHVTDLARSRVVGVKSNTESSRKQTFYCCLVAIPLLLFLSFHTAETIAIQVSWCNIMQTVRNPLEDVLPLLNTALRAIWLELLRSGLSVVIFQLLFMLMCSQLGPENKSWRKTDCLTHR